MPRRHRNHFISSLSLLLIVCAVTVVLLTPATRAASALFMSSMFNTASSISATAGSNQANFINTPFPLPLQATVLDSSSAPVSGVVVVFSAPTTGASGTFLGAGTSVNVMTDANGVATAPTFTANGVTGSYTVTATVSGAATPATFNLMNHCNAVVTNGNDSGNGSLRLALGNVCAGGTVVFAPGVTEVTLFNSELSINKSVTIQGPGSKVLTVKRSSQPGLANFRIFNIISTTATVNISGMTITGGRTKDGFAVSPGTANGNDAEGGGGINNVGTLFLSDVVVTGNRTGNGSAGSTRGGSGGLGGGITSFGALTMTNVTLSNNVTGDGATGGIGGSGGSGGALYFQSFTSAALTMTDCVVTGNQTGNGVDGTDTGLSGGGGGGGGGLYIANSSSSTTKLTNVVVSNNSTGTPGRGGYGGGGGGIITGFQSPLTIINSTIKGNHTGDGVASGGTGGSAGGLSASGPLVMIGTTVSGNTTGTSGASGGSTAGGVYMGHTATIINSTISYNSTGGIGGAGGGIYVAGPLTLINSTLTGNTTFNDFMGGGIYASSAYAPPVIKNSIIAGNGGTNAYDLDGAYNSGGNNLIGRSDGSTGFTDGVNGDKVGTNAAPLKAMLSPLGDYGGPTQTHLLLSGSPAIDAGNNSNLPQDTLDMDGDGDTAETLPVDQRGYARIVNSTVDMGAVEVDALNYAVNVTSGSHQTAAINSGFASQLVVTVTESGTPQSGIPVTFTAPASGASGTFSGSATVITDVNGVAVSPVFTANGIMGSYQVLATIAGNVAPARFNLTNTKGDATVTLGNLVQVYQGTPRPVTVTTSPPGLTYQVTYNGSTTPPTTVGTYQVVATVIDTAYAGQATGTLTINKADQTINFPAIPAKNYGDGDFDPHATASSNLVVRYNASGACFATQYTIVNIFSAGTCTITATQAGDSNYNPAPDVQRTITIGKATRSPVITSSANPSDLGQNVTFTAKIPFIGSSVASGLIQFKIDGNNAGGLVVLDSTGAASFSVSNLSVGTHVITADYSGDGNFNPSTGTLTGGQTVRTPPTLLINDIAITEGSAGTKNANFLVRLTSASNLSVKVDYATANGTATAGSDYVATSGTLTFNPFETSKLITVVVNGDTANEPDETLFMNLTNAQNAVLDRTQATLTIVNDDAPGVRFSSSVYSFNENAGHGDVTVVRTGDPSIAFSVDYASSDQAALTPCQTNNNGIASDRCDYATAAGTLRFAAGETSKTISIPLINDAYQEPDEVFNITLKNPQGAALGIFFATVTIKNDDTQPATSNPIQDQAFFIRQQYIDFLGREPEQAGFDFWMNRMNNCPQGQVCDRVDTSQRFFQSDEFQFRGFYVYRLYDAILGRLPKYAEFVPDVARLNGFQTVAEQRQSKDAYLLDFINKSEFRNSYGAFISSDGLTAVDAAGFVNALCAKAGITPASKQSLIDNLQNRVKDPAHTLEDFIQTPEMSNVGTLYYDRGFITMQYFGYLRRDPEQAGFDFWVGQLIGPNAPHKQDYRFMVGGFLQSDEYGFRFAPISATH